MPLTFDMPREQLVEYEGTNPRPDDMDQFWEERLRQLEKIDPQVEIEEANFQTDFAHCQHLFFRGMDEAKIHAKLLRPRESSSPHPGIVKFHGYSGDSGDWSEKLPYVAQGYSVAALDCRGQGGLSEDRGGVRGNTLHGHIIRGLEGPPEDMLFVKIFLDTVRLVRILMDMEEIDGTRIGVTGGSQGGGLTLACAALEPRVKLVAPLFPFLCDYKRVWDIDLAQDAYLELKEYFRKFDPRHEKEREIFAQLGYIDVQHLCPRIEGRVSMAVGLMDEICPPSTQYAAYNKIESEKSLTVYPDFGHENLPGHSDIVFQFMEDL